jgi:hypothetical protein
VQWFVVTAHIDRIIKNWSKSKTLPSRIADHELFCGEICLCSMILRVWNQRARRNSWLQHPLGISYHCQLKLNGMRSTTHSSSFTLVNSEVDRWTGD